MTCIKAAFPELFLSPPTSSAGSSSIPCLSSQHLPWAVICIYVCLFMSTLDSEFPNTVAVLLLYLQDLGQWLALSRYPLNLGQINEQMDGWGDAFSLTICIRAGAGNLQVIPQTTCHFSVVSVDMVVLSGKRINIDKIRKLRNCRKPNGIPSPPLSLVLNNLQPLGFCFDPS